MDLAAQPLLTQQKEIKIMSKCPNQQCHSESFEAVKADISGVKYPMMFIQCSECETVVGVEPTYYVPQMLQDLAKALDIPSLP
ncbi:hypothetical protein ODU63_003558 [Vibrio cholerae]|nr:hypothetical protein [Vibrio cholerae]